MVYQGYKKPLTQNDLPPAPDHLNVNDNIHTFMKHWDDHVKKNQVNFSDKNVSRPVVKLWKPVFLSFGSRLMLAFFIALFYYGFGYSSPLVSIHSFLYLVKKLI